MGKHLSKIGMRHLASVILVLSFFHILRNLSFFYIFILGAFFSIYSIIFLQWILSSYRRESWLIIFIFTLWCCASLNSIVYRAEYGEFGGSFFIGIARLWVSFFILLACVVLSKLSFGASFRFVAVFFALASLSFFYQLVFGPISWFAESSERAGTTRLSSLAGSLTSYGVLVGVAMLAVFAYFRGAFMIVISLILFLGCIISLQKAALANLLIVVIFVYWFKWCKFSLKSMLQIVSVVFVFFAGLFLGFDLSPYLDNAVGILKLDNKLTGDVTFLASIFDRLVHLPFKSLSFYSPSQLVFGVGVFGAAGALGYPGIPMAHNGLIEIIQVFGVLFGGLLIGIMFYCLLLAFGALIRRSSKSRDFNFASGAYIIWLTNFTFSGGGLFHPIGAAIFWLTVFFLIFNGRENNA